MKTMWYLQRSSRSAVEKPRVEPVLLSPSRQAAAAIDTAAARLNIKS
jgi:hypothetical protein